MIEVNFLGRLGNNLFQQSAGLFFSKKHGFDFTIKNSYEHLFKIVKNEGKKCSFVQEVNDENFESLYTKEKIECKKYVLNGFFQNRIIVDELKKQKYQIFNLKYETKEDVFIHYRIGDIENTDKMMPLKFYEKAIDTLNIDKQIFLSTDTPNHKNILYLREKYNCKLLYLQPIETLVYAKNFEHIILSQGTFSWWIGFLSQAKNIIYGESKEIWHGDIFMEEWKKINY